MPDAVAVRPSRSTYRSSPRPTADLADALGLAGPPIRVPIVTASRGRLAAPLPDAALFVLGGAVTQRVLIANRVGSDLLGPGDLLTTDPSSGGPVVTGWEVLAPASIAAIDARVLIRRHPGLGAAVFDACARRSASLALHHLLAQVASIEERVRILLPVLVDRWGVMTPAGAVLPKVLNQRVLSELLGVRRPSFTAAAGILSREGLLVRQVDGRWLVDRELLAAGP